MARRPRPYERFAEMIDRHWDGIAAYCKPENKVSLGFVGPSTTHIRVLQRRACGHARRRLSPKVLNLLPTALIPKSPLDSHADLFLKGS